MKNIVTIDFDIIMAPSIEIYNNEVPKRSWDDLLKFDQLRLLNADLNHYKKLTQWLLKIIKYISKENIIIIEDHGQIVKYLKNFNKINIYNIDHHHDLGYHLENKEERDKLNCGNWGLILKDLNILNDYHWIKNKNSILLPDNVKEFDFFTYDLIEFNLDNLPIPDKLIICLSEPWVPPMFRPLFFTWLDILNNHYKTKFEIDFERC